MIYSYLIVIIVSITCNYCRYPYNNALHHHIESIIYSCLESTNNTIIDHLFQGCGLLSKILQTDRNPVLSGEDNQVIDVTFVMDSLFEKTRLITCSMRAVNICWFILSWEFIYGGV